MLPKLLLGAGIIATLLSVLIFSGKIPLMKQGSKPQGEVVIWGTLPETPMNTIMQSYTTQAKTYAVRYVYVPEAGFNQRLLEALASGAGPDMILAPYQIILSQEGRIFPFPISDPEKNFKYILPEKIFKETFVDGSHILFGPYGATALPVIVDPMVLFYNRTLFSKHGVVNPPSTWDEVVAVTPSLIVKNDSKFVETAIALGTPSVPYAKDIIMSVVSQLGQTPVVRIPAPAGGSYFEVMANSPVTEGGEILPLTTANRNFTQFGDPGQKVYSWSDSLGNASDFFVSEKLAMYIGYASELSTLRARNPRANFEMTYFPQIRGYNTFAMGVRLYGIATLKTSKNPVAAMAAEYEIASAGVSPSVAGVIGAVPAFRQYAATPGLDPVIQRSMLVARGWYDSHPQESDSYTASMISDIINYRYGVNDASSVFVSRLRDLYSKNK
jgi:ABC-type glycerol-3-phosphate transport system substrate-binding protein